MLTHSDLEYVIQIFPCGDRTRACITESKTLASARIMPKIVFSLDLKYIIYFYTYILYSVNKTDSIKIPLRYLNISFEYNF